MNTGETHTPESVEQLAKRIFTDLHRAITSHETGSLDGNVESVHDMRVAVRRFRVALTNFAVCMRKEDRKRLQSKLENLADALGGVRDMDVMIAAMKTSMLKRSSQEKTAVAGLIQRLRARRRKRLKTLMDYLRGKEYADFKHEFSFELISSESRSGAEVIQPGAPEAPEPLGVIEEEHGQAA